MSPGGFWIGCCGRFSTRPCAGSTKALATADDMDLTLKLGLGYPEGTIALLERTGLAAHADISQALYEALGDPGFVPARRAQVAKARTHR